MTRIDKQTRAALLAYPDGWTCAACGDEHHGVLPASTDSGTICARCVAGETISEGTDSD